jgi:hypothetical protein
MTAAPTTPELTNNCPPQQSLRVQRLVKRLDDDLKLKVKKLWPVNQGHHREDGIVKWMAETAEGINLESEDTITNCVASKRPLMLRRERIHHRMMVDADMRPLNEKS